ncbi:MAG TPA: peptide chain release factor N(5)-glutamine methyltransferase [Chthonomonadaceae bacterium]|nr:peptide chain release factor N(5)-glutamine methyltransferase [Chthonomonadaceae bacterium]
MSGADRAQCYAEIAPLLSTPLALQWTTHLLDAADIENPRFEAQLLLALTLGVSRTTIVAGLRPELSTAEFRAMERLVRERERHVPLAYLRGTQEFYGLTFAVTPATLIPRPETELLVEFVLEKCREYGIHEGARRDTKKNHEEEGFVAPVFVDVGTGSGCIPIAVLAHCPEARAFAIDLSAEALEVAGRNAQAHGVTDRLRLIQGDLLTGVSGNLDIIVSNPPYIPTGEVAGLQPEVRDFEPRLALDGGADGLTLLRGLAREADRVLKPGGWLAVEVALGQADAVKELFAAYGLTDIAARRDLAGIERIVYGRKRK